MTHRAQVLVVDDETLNRDLLRRILSDRYQVLEASNGLEAIRALEENDQVRVIVLDQLMPGKTGTEVAQDAAARWPNVVCILLTGYDDDPDVARARKQGSLYRLVTKPVQIMDFREVMEEAMAEHARRTSAES